ncbi:uncharacterized protein DNG_00947 [Cephalotrichum gorgonifer]|uniref:Uncharacterized protein n=1 Tax=Cephalotrichum gorgonifer TaxID=2041049 RepID=A0AAE8MRZ9_9PEZI|nr:uncharacterized protein DNG_00947 [Cephalotrichum gorgonifer]
MARKSARSPEVGDATTLA